MEHCSKFKQAFFNYVNLNETLIRLAKTIFSSFLCHYSVVKIKNIFIAHLTRLTSKTSAGKIENQKHAGIFV